MLQPISYDSDTPYCLDQLPVDWKRLVIEANALVTGDVSKDIDFPFLKTIARYTNLDFSASEIKGGIFAYRFRYREDPAFDCAVQLIRAMSQIQKALVPQLLARTEARHALRLFAKDATQLEQQLTNANFSYLSPFLLQGTLAETLYFYGMYERYFQDHTANEAMESAGRFLDSTVGENLEEIAVFRSRHAWGDWFDPHSVTDDSYVAINAVPREFFLLCLSHSD
jgi:hypothetical protein